LVSDWVSDGCSSDRRPQLLWVQSGESAAMVADGSASTSHWVAVLTSVAAAVLTSILVPMMALRQIKQMK